MKNILLFLLLLSASARTWAWGRHGHEIVGQTAARLVSTEPNSRFMGWFSFDFGVYNNLPDLVWKRPVTYEMERPEHYMNMETFDKAFKEKPEIKDPFLLDRKEFETQFPSIAPTEGRALWRIREMEADLAKISEELRKLQDAKGDARRALQEKWLVQAGTLGHYVADLSMPLHTSEHRDGKTPEQKGIHKFFEEYCVTELFPDVFADVHHEALRRWPKFRKENEKKSLTEMILNLIRDSHGKIDLMLSIDKHNKRDLKKSAKAYRKLITERLVLSSLYLAEIFRRNLGFTVDDEKFYYFNGEPAYVKAAEGAPRPADKGK